jgi:hypothetical protein
MLRPVVAIAETRSGRRGSRGSHGFDRYQGCLRPASPSRPQRRGWALPGGNDLRRETMGTQPTCVAASRPRTWPQPASGAGLAVVTVPHHPPVTRMFYLVREHGRWLVLFSDAG